MTKTLVTRGGSIVRRRNRLGQVTGLVGLDDAAPATRITLPAGEISLDGLTLNITVPDGAPGVLIHGAGGKIVRVTQSGPRLFTKGELTDDPSTALIDLRAAVMPDGKLGPSRRYDLTGVGGENPEDPEEPEEPEDPDPIPSFTTAPSLTWSASPIVAGTTATLVEGLVDFPELLTGDEIYFYEFRDPPDGEEEEWTGFPTVPSMVAAKEFRVTVTAPYAGGVIVASSAWYPSFVAGVARQPVPGADFTVPLSEARPDAQITTFTPVILSSFLKGIITGGGLVQVTWATNLANSAAWHQVLAHPTRGGNYLAVYARTHPVTPPATDAALFTEADARRVGKMRFRYSLDTNEANCGPWSEAVDVPLLPPVPSINAGGIPAESVVRGSVYARDFKSFFSSPDTPILEWETTGTAWMTISQPGAGDGGGVGGGTVANTTGSGSVSIRARNATGWSAAAAFTLTRVDPPSGLTRVGPDAFPLTATVGTTLTEQMAARVQAGGTVTWSKVSGIAWGTINATTGVVSLVVPAAPAEGGTTTFVFRATFGASTLDWTITFTGTPVVVAPESGLPSPSNATLSVCLGLGFNSWSFSNNDGDIARVSSRHNLVSIGVAAINNAPLVVGGRTARQYLLQQIQNVCAAPNTQDGNRAPSARGGVTLQRDENFLDAICLAKLTPAVWDALTVAEKNKCDTIAKGLLATAWWQIGEDNPWVASGNNERRIDGGTFGVNWQFNFNSPSFTVPYKVAAYLGGTTFGANARAFLNTFTRAGFAAECAARGLWEMNRTFANTLTDPDGGNNPRSGPNAAQLEAGVRSLRTWRGELITSQADAQALMIREIERQWRGTIKQGIGPGYSGKRPTGYAESPAGVWGILEPTNINGATWGTGRNAYVARLTNLNDWTKWQAAGIAGQIGAPAALDASDGGMNGSGGGPRSAMMYALDECMIVLMSSIVMAAQGILPRSDPALRAAFQRQGRGALHMKLLGENGYRSFSKGGRPWNGNNRNEDWINGSAQETNYRSAVLWALWEEILKPWHDAA